MTGLTDAIDGFDPARLHHRPGGRLILIGLRTAFPGMRNTVGITRHCTKHKLIWLKDIADLPRILHEAFFVAANGRPGPVCD